MPVVAVLAAGRGRLCAQRYLPVKGQLHADGSAWLTTGRELGADWAETTCVCGELSAEERHDMQKRLGSRACWPRRPHHCAAPVTWPN